MTSRALAPGPWLAGDYGTVEDVDGNMVLRLATRLWNQDESWRELTVELAAAPDMHEALAAVIELIDSVTGPTMESMRATNAYHAAVAALAKAKSR